MGNRQALRALKMKRVRRRVDELFKDLPDCKTTDAMKEISVGFALAVEQHCETIRKMFSWDPLPEWQIQRVAELMAKPGGLEGQPLVVNIPPTKWRHGPDIAGYYTDLGHAGGVCSMPPSYRILGIDLAKPEAKEEAREQPLKPSNSKDFPDS